MNPETAHIAQKEFDRAQLELDNNNVLAALACLERALSIWDDPLWHSRLGFCIAKQRGQLTQAFELCRTAIGHDPDNSLHYLYLGKVYLIAGNTEEALHAFRQGITVGGSPELEQIIEVIGTRKSPVISFFSRDNLLNKYLGILFARLGLRQGHKENNAENNPALQHLAGNKSIINLESEEYGMKINKLLIHLHNSVEAFSLKPRHIDQIRDSLPDVSITLADGNSDFMEKLPEAECVLAWVFKPDWYKNAPKLKALFTPAAGHDWVAEDPSGRVKTFYGSFHGRIMRESLLSMILFFNRDIGKSLKDQNNRIWGRLDYNNCIGLFSQRVLIVGFGSLGHSMAELLKAFGAKVTGVKRNIEGIEGNPYVDKIITFEMLEEELPFSDHVVFVLPGGTETDGIFTARHFTAMKPGAYLYNLGRGNCYSEDDLLTALKNGPLAGAGLDVFAEEPLNPASPLWKLQNVLITPHSSAISQEYIDLFIQEWLETLKCRPN